MDKQNIFDNIDEFTAEEIVNFINQGIVTQEELEDPDNTNGLYTAQVRRRVKELIANAEPNDWNKARSINTIGSYQEYLKIYPNGLYKNEAEQAIVKLRQDNDDADWAKAVSINTEESYQEYLDTYKTGKHRDEARKAKAIINTEKGHLEEKMLWDKVDKTSIAALERFTKENPKNRYCKDANRMINDLINKDYIDYDMDALMEEINAVVTDRTIIDRPTRIYELIKTALDENNIEIDDLLDVIEDDNNTFGSGVIKNLVRGGYFSYEDLEDLSINKDFIRQIAKNVTKIKFEPSARSLNIERNSTEVFFWGIPSSGKTCALGAILSVAQSGLVSKSMTLDTECQGFVYMNLLPQCFKLSSGVTVLPEGTPATSSYEMGFDLEDENHKIHPITCIDFAGEMIKCMFKKQGGLSLTDSEERALRDLTNVLGGKDEKGQDIGNRTGNRKIHFFVVEYGAENRTYDGLPQMNYLVSALEYIKKTGIFKSNTDAIYLIVTKVDKIKAKNDDERNSLLSQYVGTHYSAFYGGLQRICREYQINGGTVPVLPFSLGTVCFQDFCKLNAKYATSIVEIILNRSHGFASGRRGWFERTFRG